MDQYYIINKNILETRDIQTKNHGRLEFLNEDQNKLNEIITIRQIKNKKCVSDINYWEFHIGWDTKEIIETNRILNNEKLFFEMQQKRKMKKQD